MRPFPMQKAIPAAILLFLATTGSANDTFEYPLRPARMLADSFAEPCGMCVQAARKKAFRLLETGFPPGRILRASQSGLFMKAPGGSNLFFAGGGQKRTLHLSLKEEGGKDIYLPLVLFRFHTSKNHLVGVSRADYSDIAIEKKFKGLPPGTEFTGSLRIIEFKSGDGATFTFSPVENALYIHCKIESAEFPPGR